MVRRLLIAALVASAAQARADGAQAERIYGTMVTVLAMASICQIELDEPGATRGDLVELGDIVGKRLGVTNTVEELVQTVVPIFGAVDDCRKLSAEIRKGARSTATEARRIDRD